MKTEYKGYANKSGVYKIVNLLNGRIYIGSAKCFKVRANQHFKSLQENKHQNKYLQNDFNKCGEENFVFEVIEVVEGEQKERLLVEQKYIDQYFDKGNQCYNFKSKTEAESRSCSSKTPEETSRKRSESSKKMWEDPEYRNRQSEIQSAKTKEQWQNPEFRQKKIEGMKGKCKREWTEEEKQRQSVHMKNSSYALQPKTFVLRNPEGEIVVINNLTEFCRNNPGLKRSGMNMLHLGMIKTYKGWSKPEATNI